MRQSALKSLSLALAAGTIALMATTGDALAGPISGATWVFSSSTGTQPSNAGTITLTQNGAGVNVTVDLLNGYGFVNTGGPHTFFGFNLADTSNLNISFLTPAGGTFSPKPGTTGTLSLDTNGGPTPSFGDFNLAIDSSLGNGSSKGYFGDLVFNLTRTGGTLYTEDFIKNTMGYFFTADLSDGTNTGQQAWSVGIDPPGPETPTKVPEPLTMSLFGAGLAGMVALRRRKSSSGAAAA